MEEKNASQRFLLHKTLKNIGTGGSLFPTNVKCRDQSPDRSGRGWERKTHHKDFYCIKH